MQHSPLARVARLTRKELSEILRDRRTIVTLVAMPLLLYPLLSVAFQQFLVASKVDPDHGAEYRIGIGSDAEAQLLSERLSKGEAALQRFSGGKAEKRGKAPKLFFRTAEPEDLRKELEDGMLDLVVRVPGADKVATDRPFALRDKDWVFPCEVAYRPGDPAAMGALAFVEHRLTAANEADLQRRLNLPDAVPRTVVLRLKRAPLEEKAGDSFLSLSALVPLILILMTITGAVYPAIDLTAGERERGTLEILVAAPVPRFALLSAKYFSVVTVAVLTALVNLVSMAITLQLSGLGRLVFPDGISLILLVELFALLLLFAAFFSALLLCLTSFARGFKEAQAYLIPLMLASLAPGVLAMMPGIELTPTLAAVPLVNIVLLARDLIGGTAQLPAAALVVASTLLYAFAALSLAARVFGAESVLYSEQSGWADLLHRPDEPSATGSIASALWCLALAVPIHFLTLGLLQSLGPPPAAVQVALMAALSLVLFGLVPAAAAHLGRVRWPSGFGLVAPRPAAVAAGLLLGVSLWPLVLWLLALQHGADESALKERLTQVASSMQQIDRAALLVMTIIAAITEEFFFRGYLFGALRARTGAAVTIGATALLFGVTHVFLGGALGLERLLPSTLLGVILGVVCWVSGSVIPGMVLHVCHNVLLVVLAQTELARREQIPLEWLAASVAVAGAAMLPLWLWGRKRLPLAA